MHVVLALLLLLVAWPASGVVTVTQTAPPVIYDTATQKTHVAVEISAEKVRQWAASQLTDAELAEIIAIGVKAGSDWFPAFQTWLDANPGAQDSFKQYFAEAIRNTSNHAAILAGPGWEVEFERAATTGGTLAIMIRKPLDQTQYTTCWIPDASWVESNWLTAPVGSIDHIGYYENTTSAYQKMTNYKYDSAAKPAGCGAWVQSSAQNSSQTGWGMYGLKCPIAGTYHHRFFYYPSTSSVDDLANCYIGFMPATKNQIQANVSANLAANRAAVGAWVDALGKDFNWAMAQRGIPNPNPPLPLNNGQGSGTDGAGDIGDVLKNGVPQGTRDALQAESDAQTPDDWAGGVGDGTDPNATTNLSDATIGALVGGIVGGLGNTIGLGGSLNGISGQLDGIGGALGSGQGGMGPIVRDGVADGIGDAVGAGPGGVGVPSEPFDGTQYEDPEPDDVPTIVGTIYANLQGITFLQRLEEAQLTTDTSVSSVSSTIMGQVFTIDFADYAWMWDLLGTCLYAFTWLSSIILVFR